MVASTAQKEKDTVGEPKSKKTLKEEKKDELVIF